MILITGQYRMPAATLDEARAVIARVITATRAEAGCLAYSHAEDVCEAGLFRICESWSDRDALKQHFDQPHMKTFQAERAALGVTDREVTLHEVVVSETL